MFPQYELQIGPERQISYGQLELILECLLPAHRLLRLAQPSLRLFALIAGCPTHGRDAAQVVVSFDKLASTSHIVDLRAVCASVGHFPTGTVVTRHAIVDRSDGWARTVFLNDDTM